MTYIFRSKYVLIVIGILALITFRSTSGDGARFEQEILNDVISRLLQAEEIQQSVVSDVTLSGHIIERRLKGNGETKEEKRLERITYLRRRSESTLDAPFKMDLHERYLSFEKNGEEQEDEKLYEEIRNKLNKRKKSASGDISDPLVDVFLPKHRYAYNYSYLGVDDTLIQNYVCHIVQISPNPEVLKSEKNKSRLEGKFYIDTLSCRLVHADFRPAKLKSNMFFKLKELELSLSFQAYSDSIWFPEYIHVKGKGKAGLFFTVHFESEGFFTDPIINDNLPDSLFNELMSVGH